MQVKQICLHALHSNRSSKRAMLMYTFNKVSDYVMIVREEMRRERYQDNNKNKIRRYKWGIGLASFVQYDAHLAS